MATRKVTDEHRLEYLQELKEIERESPVLNTVKEQIRVSQLGWGDHSLPLSQVLVLESIRVDGPVASDQVFFRVCEIADERNWEDVVVSYAKLDEAIRKLMEQGLVEVRTDRLIRLTASAKALHRTAAVIHRAKREAIEPFKFHAPNSGDFDFD